MLARAESEGFSAVRVASVDSIPQAPARLAGWLDAGNHGDMAWMTERTAERAAPGVLWPEARSVVMLGMSYADLAAAAHLSCVDYLGDVPWEEDEAARAWYARIKSRPSFRPLLSDRIPGMAPSAHYDNLDF